MVLKSPRGIGLRHTTIHQSLSGEHRVWFKITQSMILRLFMGFPHRLSEGYMPQLGLLAFKGNGNGVASVLIGHVHCVGWRIARG